MPKPKISIIVPIWNTAKFLPKCLGSLTSQTLREIEIICIDDGSTDGSGEILSEYAKRDKRVVVVKQKNSGQSVARNNGLANSTAPYIMFCDSDDYYDETMCEKMFCAITKNKTDLAMCGIKITYMAYHNMKNSDDYYYGLKRMGLHDMDDDLILATDVAPTNKIFKKELLNKYNIKFPVGLRYEDAYFCMSYFAISSNIYFVFQKLYNYIRRPGSTMSDTWDKNAVDYTIDHLHIVIRLYEFFKEHGLLHQKKNLFWRIFCIYYVWAYRYAKSRKSRKKTKKLAQDFLQNKQQDLNGVDIKTRSQVMSITSLAHSAKLTTRQILGRVYRKISPGYHWQNNMINSANHVIGQNQNMQTRLDAIEQQLKENGY